MDCFFAEHRTVKTCVTCGTQFAGKLRERKVRCSHKCQYIDQSRGVIHVKTNGRTGYRRDIGFSFYFKSALEADFARYLSHCRIPFEYESKTFLIEGKAYTPDFFLPELELLVELKGPEDDGTKFSEKMRKNLRSIGAIVESGVDLVVITQKQFINALKHGSFWSEIPNLEQRNYRKTKELVVTHEDQNHLKTNDSTYKVD